jgi:RHS repeat-associated protein
MAVTNYYTVDGSLIAEETGGSRLDNHLDALGSVTAQTDSTQSVTASGRYSAYGTAYWSEGVQASTRFGWCGSWGYRKTQASNGGLPHAEKYVRARHYSANDGRWTTVDPLWPSEPQYLYVDANPLTFADPSGRLKFRGDCPDILVWWLNSICNRVRQLSANYIEWINECIRRNSNGQCPRINVDLQKCVSRFCRQDGIVNCYVHEDIPGHPTAAGLAYSGGLANCDPTDPYDEIAIAVGKRGSSVWFDVLPKLWVRPNRGARNRIDLSNLGLTFLHEVGHACGIGHGVTPDGKPRPVDEQCNDHFAGCIYKSIHKLLERDLREHGALW